MNLFFDDGCKSFILIWSVIGTEGGRTLRPPSEANAEAGVDWVSDGVKDWIDNDVPSTGRRHQRRVLEGILVRWLLRKRGPKERCCRTKFRPRRWAKDSL